MRRVWHLTTDNPAAELEGLQLEGDRHRFVAFGPRSGGAPLRELRRLFAGKGRVRFGGTPARIYVDLDRVVPDTLAEDRPLVALDMIARSDAEGLERAILSALPFVDEIVVGIDDRSDAATRAVAEAYADHVHTFGAAELGIPPEKWAADAIDFAAARNIGRALVRSPWALVIDTDEYIRHALDWRPALRAMPEEFGAVEVTVCDRGARNVNFMRLARTEFRWWSAAHNQLATRGANASAVCEILHDTSLRTEAEKRRRTDQRNQNIEQLRQAAAAGEINALYHLALHLIGQGDDEGPTLAEDYRSRLEVEGPGRDHRAQLAMACACMYYNRDDLDRADMWATRVLLDGPRPEALCLKGDISEDRGDLETALRWYEAACVIEDFGAFKWQHITAHKRGRRGGLRRALGLPQAA